MSLRYACVAGWLVVCLAGASVGDRPGVADGEARGLAAVWRGRFCIPASSIRPSAENT